LSWSLDHVGPMTWTVEDTALMLQAIAGHDPKDPTSSRAPVPDYTASLKRGVKGLTIGMPRHYFFDTDGGVDPETVGVVDAALAELERLGARLREVRIPSLHFAGAANNVIMLSEAFAYHRHNLQSQVQNYGKIVRTRFLVGGLFTSADYVQAQRVRSRVKREMGEALRRVDVLAMPTGLKPATALKDLDPMSTMMSRSLTAPCNESGLPAISVPCGFSDTGLPIGLQIAGKPFDEPTVLRVAYAYEQAGGWTETRPKL
jgi:aspartyl-tRNA(Asn)/glutamyl-tRNA(Gln) amidotransferase subunit A